MYPPPPAHTKQGLLLRQGNKDANEGTPGDTSVASSLFFIRVVVIVRLVKEQVLFAIFHLVNKLALLLLPRAGMDFKR